MDTPIIIEINSTLAIIIFMVILVASLASKAWLKAKIKESVKSGYSESLEEIKDSLSWEGTRKKQATEVAEMFSLWHKWKYFPKDSQDPIKYELQKKYWELALWIDADILRAVNEAFETGNITSGVNNNENGHKEAMLKVRKLVVDKDDDISIEEVTHFLSDMENHAINLNQEVAKKTQFNP